MPKRCPTCARLFSDAEGFCSLDGATLEPVHDADPMIGQILDGRYRIRSRLGEGGMSTVFLAEQIALGRDVAIKMLRPDRSDDPKASERLLREARAMSALRSPHVVGLVEAGRLDSGAVYLVMERLHGETLDALLARAGRLAVDEALPIVVGIARALADAHAAGVVHRDLKPSNVFLAASAGQPRFVKVLDFGIAWIQALGEGRLTSSQAIPGTPSYVAPERIRFTEGGAEQDARADVYAVGLVAFELIAGRLPWATSGTIDALVAHLETPAPRLDTIAPDAPGWLADLVARCLAKSPALRPADGAALLDALTAGPAGSTSPSRDAPTMDDARVATAPPARSRTALWGTLVAFAAGGGFVGGRVADATPRPPGVLVAPAPGAALATIVAPPPPAPRVEAPDTIDHADADAEPDVSAASVEPVADVTAEPDAPAPTDATTLADTRRPRIERAHEVSGSNGTAASAPDTTAPDAGPPPDERIRDWLRGPSDGGP